MGRAAQHVGHAPQVGVGAGHVEVGDRVVVGVEGAAAGVALDAAHGEIAGGVVLDEVEGLLGHGDQVLGRLVELLVETGLAIGVILGDALLQMLEAKGRGDFGQGALGGPAPGCLLCVRRGGPVDGAGIHG